MSAIPSNSPIASVVSDAPPKPVVPAEHIASTPAEALEPLTKTEGTFLEKAVETILPVCDCLTGIIQH